jgi:nucleosome binding factor SPN SPT16 subunit
MTWLILIVLLFQIAVLVIAFLETKNLFLIKKAVEDLILKFVESNQIFYEHQKAFMKTITSHLDQSNRQLKEIASIKNSASEISNILPIISDTSKNINEMSKIIKDINTLTKTVIKMEAYNKKIMDSVERLDSISKSLITISKSMGK